MPNISMEEINHLSFDELKEEVESWELEQVPDYNLPNWEEDSILVLRAKAIVIYNQLFGE